MKATALTNDRTSLCTLTSHEPLVFRATILFKYYVILKYLAQQQLYSKQKGKNAIINIYARKYQAFYQTGGFMFTFAGFR